MNSDIHTKVVPPNNIDHNLVTDIIDHTDVNEYNETIINHAGSNNNGSKYQQNIPFCGNHMHISDVNNMETGDAHLYLRSLDLN